MPRPDLTVYAKDYPEPRLVVEVRPGVSQPYNQDPAVRQVVRYMWGANCHYGLIVTPAETFVLRDDFTTSGPESIRVSAVLPTRTLFSRLDRPFPPAPSGQQLEALISEWVTKLAGDYEGALPDDPDVLRAFFPDIAGAVAEGRVVTEAAAG
jgi:hypothetical protein